MQKLFDFRNVSYDDYDSLKKLWLSCFDDSPEVVDAFFSKTVTPENIIAAFDGRVAVGALYLIDSFVTVAGRRFNAYYIYGVCTHPRCRNKGIMTRCFEILENIVKNNQIDYIFLVPAEESLFKMYEKLGFKTGIEYSEEVIYNKGDKNNKFTEKPMDYESYVKLRENITVETPVITLGERGFNTFFHPVGDHVACVYNGSDYAVFEKENEAVIVHEWTGNRESVLEMVFSLSCSGKIILRKPAEKVGIPFGMYRAFGNAPEMKSALFGIPYGG